MKPYERNNLSPLHVNLVVFTFGEPFINLIDPAGTGIGINIECAYLAFAQMEISAIIECCGYCIYIARRIIVIRIVITEH